MLVPLNRHRYKRLRQRLRDAFMCGQSVEEVADKLALASGGDVESAMLLKDLVDVIVRTHEKRPTPTGWYDMHRAKQSLEAQRFGGEEVLF